MRYSREQGLAQKTLEVEESSRRTRSTTTASKRREPSKQSFRRPSARMQLVSAFLHVARPTVQRIPSRMKRTARRMHRGGRTTDKTTSFVCQRSGAGGDRAGQQGRPRRRRSRRAVYLRPAASNAGAFSVPTRAVRPIAGPARPHRRWPARRRGPGRRGHQPPNPSPDPPVRPGQQSADPMVAL